MRVSLQKGWLSDGLIIEPTESSRIGQLFQRIAGIYGTRCTTLTLKGKAWTKLPELRYFPYLKELILEETRVQTLRSLPESVRVVRCVKNDHLIFPPEDIDEFELRDRHIEILPPIFLNGSKMKKLSILNCGLKLLPFDGYAQAVNLAEIHLYGNSIMALPKSLTDACVIGTLEYGFKLYLGQRAIQIWGVNPEDFLKEKSPPLLQGYPPQSSTLTCARCDEWALDPLYRCEVEFVKNWWCTIPLADPACNEHENYVIKQNSPPPRIALRPATP